MDYNEILALALATANHLGIKVKDPQLVLKNMQPLIGVTTIVSNESCVLWIDKHYIAYSRNNSHELIYIMADKAHVNEELKNIGKMLHDEKAFEHFITIANVMEQLHRATAYMKQHGVPFFVSDEAETFKPYYAPKRTLQKERLILCLCGKCRSDFEIAGANRLRRVDYDCTIKESCTYCGVRDGYDYEVVPKRRKECAV